MLCPETFGYFGTLWCRNLYFEHVGRIGRRPIKTYSFNKTVLERTWFEFRLLICDKHSLGDWFLWGATQASPVHSPDFKHVRFFLWGFLKSKVFKHRSQTIDNLKERITEEIATMPIETFWILHRNYEDRLQQYMVDDGHHLEDIIFKIIKKIVVSL